jgi:hypothetical protein
LLRSGPQILRLAPTKERVMERHIVAIVIELARALGAGRWALGAVRRYEDLRYNRRERHAPPDTPRQIFDEFYAHQSDSAIRRPAQHWSLRPGLSLRKDDDANASESRLTYRLDTGTTAWTGTLLPHS